MRHALGSSLTRWAIAGTSGLFYPSNYEYLGKGGLREWADLESWRWDKWEEDIANYGDPESVWWMPTIRRRSTPIMRTTERRQAVRVHEKMRLILGNDVTIYVSGQPEHVPEGLCPVVNRNGYLMSWDVARKMVAHPSNVNLKIGPVTSPITAHNYVGPEDPCHQGPVGIKQHGSEVSSFFASLEDCK